MEEPRDRAAAGASAGGFPAPRLVRPWFLAVRMTAVAGALAGTLFLTLFGHRADFSVVLMGYAYIVVPFAVAWWGAGSRSASASRRGALTGFNLLALALYVSALVPGLLDALGYLAGVPLVLMSPFQLLGSILAIVATRRHGSPHP